MITFLEGTLAESLPGRLAINVGGVGYEVLVPLSTSDGMPAINKPVRILTHFHVREQEQTLYGFRTTEERDLFRLLIDRVSGIGPKLSLAVLSGMSVTDFKNAVVGGDIAALSTISGLGKKTAERIVLELRDKVGVTSAWEAASEGGEAVSGKAGAINDAVLAMISLGYKQADALKAVKKVADAQDGEPDANDLIRVALRGMK